MNAIEAREYIKSAIDTETGKDILQALYGAEGAAAVIAKPEGGDDRSTIVVATAIRKELRRRYGF